MKNYLPSFFKSETPKEKKPAPQEQIQTSEHELKQQITSKIDLEVIIGLKNLINNFHQKYKNLDTFTMTLITLVNHKNIYIRKLVVLLLEPSFRKENELLTLLYNNIDQRLTRDTNLTTRFMSFKLASQLKHQSSISKDCFNKGMQFSFEANPGIRRAAVMALLSHLKHYNHIDEIQLEDTIKKILGDPHPLVSSLGIELLIQLNNKDYFSTKIPIFFDSILEKLNCLDDYYLEKTIYYLTNFSLYFLVTKKENRPWLEKFIVKLNSFSKSINPSISISSLSSLNILYKKIVEFKVNKELVSKERVEIMTKTLVSNIINSSSINSDVGFGFGKNRFLTTYSDGVISNTYLNTFSNTHSLSYKIMFYDLTLDFISSLLKDYNSLVFKILGDNIRTFRLNYQDESIIIYSKLQILILVINDDNYKRILENMSSYLNISGNIKPKTAVIKAMYLMTKKDSVKIKTYISKRLIDMINSSTDEVSITNEILLTMRNLLFEIEEYRELLIINLISLNFFSLASEAKANIIFLLGKFISLKPTLIFNFYKKICLTEENYSREVKEQLMVMGLNLTRFIGNKEDKDGNYKVVLKITEFNLKKMLNDDDFAVRERARIISILIKMGAFDSLDKQLEVTNEDNENSSIIKLISFDKKELNIKSNSTANYIPTNKMLNSFENVSEQLLKLSYENDNIETINIDEVRQFTMEKFVCTFQEEKVEIKQDRIGSCTNKKDTNDDIRNFNEQFQIKEIEEYKKKLEEEMNKLLKGNTQDDEEEQEAKIVFDN